jgi:MFS superfamily sulfate permease-like transporter
MAYATIAGLPVQVGLYTAIVPLLVYALVGIATALGQHDVHDRGV